MAAASGEAPDPKTCDPTAVALRAAAVQSLALVLVNAAQHVQRTTMLVEAATARALSLVPGQAGPDADQGLAVARAALAEALTLFEAAQDQARTLGGPIMP